MLDQLRPTDRAHLATELDRTRARSLGLLDGLTEAEQHAQVSPLMSPFVWDLAHIGNYEELWLLRALDGRAPIEPTYDDLYNAFEHPRWERPSLPILGPTEARRYLDQVRDHALQLLARADLGDPSMPLLHEGYVYGLVLQHEHQHDETILATHQLRGDSARLPFAPDPPPATAIDVSARPEMCRVAGGRYRIGTSDEPWAYDNERGAHDVELAGFLIDTTPATNRSYLAFVEDGGYDDERLWHQDGWSWRTSESLVAPQFWSRSADGWTVQRFGEPLDLSGMLDEPVQHVCWYEADAFCRWAGKRLPTEAEWEVAATWHPDGRRRHPWGDAPADQTRANLGQRRPGPDPVGARPAGASAVGCLAMMGDVWEWTASSFEPYPGFRAWPYREYSEVFWGAEHKVLRGGSWATDPLAARGTFRNWDLPIRRQIFAGFRAARDA